MLAGYLANSIDINTCYTVIFSIEVLGVRCVAIQFKKLWVNPEASDILILLG